MNSLENAAEWSKRQKFTAVAPSSIGDSYHRSVQCQSRERLFNYRQPTGYTGELPEAGFPPIEVLFSGFGSFLEIWRAAPATHSKPDSGTLHIHINEFVAAISRVYVDELARRTETLAILNKIFPQKGPGARIDSPSRTDGLSCYRDIPCILVELRNEGPTKAIAIAELVAYYKPLVDGLCKAKPTVVNGSRLPTLGITIIGMFKFKHYLTLPIDSIGSHHYIFRSGICFLARLCTSDD